MTGILIFYCWAGIRIFFYSDWDLDFFRVELGFGFLSQLYWDLNFLQLDRDLDIFIVGLGFGFFLVDWDLDSWPVIWFFTVGLGFGFLLLD